MYTLDGHPEYEALGITAVEAGEGWIKSDELEKELCRFNEGGKTYAVYTMRLYEGSAAACNYKRPYINVADKRAVDEFIRNTYEAYAKNLDNLGRDVEAFFTDEPGLMEAYILDGPYK